MNTLRLHPNDPVVVALCDLATGDDLGVAGAVARQPIPSGHKVAIRAIAQGEPVLKFGQVIGLASRPILPGEHVHTHNLGFTPSAASHAMSVARHLVTGLPPAEADTFMGIVRADGQVGTRNYIGVLTTVNCSATVARLIADRFRPEAELASFPNVDGVVALTTKGGCASSETGEAISILRRTLAGYVRHPNFAAVLLVGLGCENNQIRGLLAEHNLTPGERLQTLSIQEAGGTQPSVSRGVDIIREMLPRANAVSRQPVPVSQLKLGLECGGSDGFSAISANPALGIASDILVQHGGTSILSETPEIYGAENLLLSRAASPAVGQKLLDLLAWWEAYVAHNHETLDSNPAPGNKAGGLTTILEKSLGAASKGGCSELMEVYRYAEPVRQSGLVFMDTPGFDPVSVTGQVAGGATIVGFTTGRGSCFGCKPAPSLKLATNTPLFERMRDDMDLNCGEIVDGTATLAEMGARIYQLLLETASGRKTKSELLRYGDDEFAPWVLGATL